MRLSFGLLQVTLPYTYKRGKTIIYQRAVPTELRTRYKGVTVKHDLKTSNVSLAARKVDKLNQRYEAEWAGLQADPKASPKALKAHADALLREFGLAPGDKSNDPQAVDLFLNLIEHRLFTHARQDSDKYESAALEDYLSPVEVAAFHRLKGQQLPTLSDALELHLTTHRKRDDKEFTVYQTRAFDTLLRVTGDKAVSEFTRDDARKYIEHALAEGAATTTVRRRLGVMRAVFTTWKREKALATPNPFEGLAIANEGKDAKKRKPFSADELKRLYSICREKNDDPRWLLALLTDTGARLGEIAGLALADIKLKADVPHLVIQEHPWRSLKNQGSARTVPLVGASLWAAQRVMDTAKPKQVYAFPRYTDGTTCNSTAASAALVSWIRRKGFDHVVHELRHTMADRLRNVGCPKDIRYAIDGHASQDVGDEYGSGFGLPIVHEWLKRVALTG